MDPVLLSVLGHAHVAVAQEMGVNLYRSARSTIIREVRDLATAVCDADGNTLAMGNFTPMLLNALQPAAEALRERYDFHSLRPDEALVTNDPFNGGQHVNDILLFTPIFAEGELVGLAGANAHHLDIGGAGTALHAGATEVFQEGIVFPPMKIVLGDDWEQEVFGRVLAANVRAPDKTVPDFAAQIAACRTGERGVQELVAQYGLDGIRQFHREILDYTDRLARQSIWQIPDGVYRGESALEDDGIDGGPHVVRVAVSVDGDQLSVSFNGTDPQVRGFVNVPWASTVGTTRTTLLSILQIDPRLVNAGAFRAITIDAPVGTLVRPAPPAATRARALACYRIFNAVNEALSDVIPDRITAPGFDSQTAISFSRRSPDGEGFNILTEVMGSGLGGLQDQPGASGMMPMLTNAMNTPIESVEIEFPFLRIARYGLVPGSGGAGGSPGGEGIERVYDVLEDDIAFAFYSDRHRAGAPGLQGGEDGAPGICLLERDGQSTALGSKVNVSLRTGDRIVVRTGGGAGFGPAPKAS